ncbi:hypothetical protein [Actinoplanes sp. L3-i22]|uniref:hypothetical protein n=1 Tax=Actinoplanes sp. L3-i22 TaxID=2836373 RepID=UPI001C73ED31|nr:hypothetical protein [Actinoplanes sp. L3-i22]BCY11069.1 hypothetical protein L3i22_061570 [Actinoplanes sp. L3-i22]
MKRLIVDTHASSCYFRTSVGGDGRKALVQVTERRNLNCAHCFVSSTQADIGVQYVLMNPLSAFRRGVRSQGRPATDADAMRAVAAVTSLLADQLAVVKIRFPNDDLPLGGCDAGRLVYVFDDGRVAVRPYLAFAVHIPASMYQDTEFLACGKGCPAAVVSRGGLVGDLDSEHCPVAEPGERTLLPLVGVSR